MTRKRKTVEIEVRTLWVSLAAVAVLLGCAVTAITLLITQPRRSARPDGGEEVAADARRRAPRGDPSARVSPPIPVAPTPTPIPTIPSGRFVYAPESMFDARFEPLRPLFADGRLARTIEAVNVYALEHDIVIKTNQRQGCVPGYDATSHQVMLCVAETAAIYDRARSVMGEDTPLDDTDALRTASDALTFRALHGMGQALASDLQLPGANDLDRAGDEFATLVLVQNGRAQAGVEGMSAALDQRGHGLDPSRLELVVCLALGGDPMRAGLDANLDRTKCVADYRRVDDLWTKALEPFTRGVTSRMR